ncbi:MAG: ribosomal RNA small subunit methyltransferase A [Pirellulales bacterium]|nr:ribosomal RNA small subunit methyltransferase A [Pirellulales bacterium]
MELNSRHGQNFLIDLNLQRVIVESAELSPHDVILEVGTGTGALTALIAPYVAHVVTVEIDTRLHQLASEELIDLANVTMLQQDALKNKNTIASGVLAAVDGQLMNAAGRQFKLVANLAYNIATPLITNLLALDRPPELMVVTIQKEVADRIAAKPGTKDYGALSIWVQSQCEVEVLRQMPPAVFWPRPKVDSAIVRIRLDAQRRASMDDRPFFHQLVRSLFLHRRKFLRGVLVAAYKHRLDKPAIDAILAELRLPDNARAEELEIPQMLQLSAAIRGRIQ